MGLKFVTSSNLNSLIDFFEQERKVKNNVFTKEAIIVPNNAFAKSLKLKIARQDQVFLNYNFFLPNTFWQYLKSLLQEILISESDHNLEYFTQDIYDKNYLKWLILKEFQTNPKNYPELKYFLLENDQFKLKENKQIHQLSKNLANVFDEYFYHYHDLEKLILDFKNTQIKRSDFQFYYNWQIRLLENIFKIFSTPNRQQQLELLKKNITSIIDHNFFFQKIYIFFIPPISPFYIELFNILSETDLEICLLGYSFEIATDELQFSSQVFTEINDYQKAIEKGIIQIEQFIQLNKIVKTKNKHTLLVQSDTPLKKKEKEKLSFLKNIQNCFLGIQKDFFSQNGNINESLLDKIDNSVQIHHCTNPLSELENVRELILTLLNENKKKREEDQINLEDILILSPSLENFQPYLSYVFSNIFSKKKSEQAIFYDSEETVATLFDCISKIFSCLEGEILASKLVLELLEVKEICNTFSLQEDDLEIIHYWLEDCNFLNQETTHSILHWENAIDNAFISYALLPSNQDCFLEDRIPLFKFNKGLSNSKEKYISLAKFLKLFTALKNLQRQYRGYHTLLEWKKNLENVLKFFLVTDKKKTLLQKIFLLLNEEYEITQYKGLISLKEIMEWLAEKSQYFKKKEYNIRGLRIGSLENFKGISAKVIFLIGMQDNSFPKSNSSTALSLFNIPKFKINIKDLNQQKSWLLLLQFFFLAKHFFYLSYHQNTDTNTSNKLSFVVQNFWYNIKSFFPVKLRKTIDERYSHKHLSNNRFLKNEIVNKENRRENYFTFNIQNGNEKNKQLQADDALTSLNNINFNQLLGFYQNSLKFHYRNNLQMKVQEYLIAEHGKLLLTEPFWLLQRTLDFLKSRQFNKDTLSREISILKKQSFFSKELIGNNFSKKLTEFILRIFSHGEKLFSHNVFDQSNYKWNYFNYPLKLNSKDKIRLEIFSQDIKIEGQFLAYNNQIINKSLSGEAANGFIKNDELKKGLGFSLKEYFQTWFYHLFLNGEGYEVVLFNDSFLLTFKKIEETMREQLIVKYLQPFLQTNSPFFLPNKITKKYIEERLQTPAKMTNLDALIQKYWYAESFQNSSENEELYEQERDKYFIKPFLTSFPKKNYFQNLVNIIDPMIEHSILTELKT